MVNKIFDSVAVKKNKMSAFDLSREQKLSCNMGELIPTYLEEVLPSDQFSVKTETLLRFAPMLAPIMHRVNVYLHYFFVPHRIVWNEWEEFITGGKNGTSAPTFPTFTMDSTVQTARLSDYLGIPIDATPTLNTGFEISSLPYRAYQKIWNDYYRDQTLQNEIDVHTASKADLCTLRNRCWEKDYFTSALPFAQRGVTPNLPIGIEYMDQSIVVNSNTGTPTTNTTSLNASNGVDPGMTYAGNTIPGRIENIEALTLTINQLRETSAIQRFLERNARGGARYIEYIKQFFDGAPVKDSRLQRAEYLGGGMQPVMISEVLNTTGTVDNEFGGMAGHGIAAGTTNEFTKTFEEHGYVIGIMSVIPKSAYQYGIPKTFLKTDKYDYYNPEFANLGEQPILGAELYYDESDNNHNKGTFGYQQRYAEYKYGQSTVHGEFRSVSPGTLDFWHLARKFASKTDAVLNASFVECVPDKRIFAITDPDEQVLWVQLYHDVKARRPMPYHALPSLQ